MPVEPELLLCTTYPGPMMPMRSRMISRSARFATAAALVFTAPATLTAQARAFDHADLDAALRAHVRDGLVDYDAIAHDGRLDRYLGKLEAFDPIPLPVADRLAFWLNTYNAYTIALIVRHGERTSIRNINRTFGLALRGPWHERLVRVGGRRYSLDQVEHEIIRPTFHDPRVHFALVCAALGCPSLRSEAYRADALDAQLDDQARQFLLASPAKNSVEVAAAHVMLSPIFDWYKDDFGGTPAAIGRVVARYFPLGVERSLLESGHFELSFTRYDWRLNARQGTLATPRAVPDHAAAP